MITRQTTIGELLGKHPEAIDILLDFGIEWVGCHASPNESIEDGCIGHGMTDDKIDEIVDQINKGVSTKCNNLCKHDEQQKSKSCGSTSCCGGNNCR